MHPAARTLAEALAPVSLRDFLEKYLGQNFLVCKGQPGRFAGLLSWTDLNGILRSHRLDAPRLRLAREGKQVSPETYITYRSNKKNASLRTPRLRSADLTRHLRQGATLIIDSVDELQEPVTQLAENFEEVLRARIQVNLYAGWRTSRGFDLHWDDHDVLILQVAGRKHWKVYPMTRLHPLSGDPLRDAMPPSTPLWEGLLEDGDTLYIPRGWWHVALPLDEPTLHLTVGLHMPNGTDLLAWFAERLRDATIVRKDVPRFADAADGAFYLNQMHEAWQKAWTPGLLAEYFAQLDARSQSRPQFDLPWSAAPAVLPPGDDWAVKWVVPRPVAISSDGDGCVEFSANGREWSFASAAAPLLERMQAERVCPAAVLFETSPDMDRETVRAFVKELASSGLVAVTAGEA